MILRFWSDFFEVSEPTPNKQQLYFSTQTPSASSVFISNCLFSGCTSTSNGGALCCTSVSYLLAASTSFTSCTTNGLYGGAIYFYNSGSQCVLHKVCGSDCISTNTSSRSEGQFVHIRVNNGKLSKNYLNYSSTARCVSEISNARYMLLFNYGKIFITSANISMNKCQHYSAICCSPFSDSHSVTCSMSYSSVTDNVATSYICICLYAGGSNLEIKCCNIIRNTQGAPSQWGTLYIGGNMMIEDSCIRENTATYIFYSETGSITLSNCTVDKTGKTGSLIIQNTVTKSFIHTLDHMSIQNCHIEYVAIGTLTSNKQIYCNTCKKLLYQYQLSDIVSLHNILIFNFIHPYASGDPLY
jgi:hypothetical protein